MHIVIDRDSAEPPFSQLSSQIETAIRTGELAVGTRLATVRSLADQLNTAPGTVARAYRELERRGLIDTRGRQGTFVSDPVEERTRHRLLLSEMADTYARTADQFGIRPTDALDLVDQAIRHNRVPRPR